MRELRGSYLRFSQEEGFEGLASSLRHYSAIGVSEEGFVRFRREVLGLGLATGGGMGRERGGECARVVATRVSRERRAPAPRSGGKEIDLVKKWKRDFWASAPK
jgi:hypothetical protein